MNFHPGRLLAYMENKGKQSNHIAELKTGKYYCQARLQLQLQLELSFAKLNSNFNNNFNLS